MITLTPLQERAIRQLLDQIDTCETLDERFQEPDDEQYVTALRELHAQLKTETR